MQQGAWTLEASDPEQNIELYYNASIDQFCLKNREAAEQANSYAQQLETKRAEVERLIASLTQMIDKTIRTRQLISVTPFNLCPTDWNLFSREQKLALGALVNNSKTMGTLINERIG